MWLYIDESKDDINGYYVVSGYVSHDDQLPSLLVHECKDAVRSSTLGKIEKSKINQDIKESYLHRNHQNLLSKMIEIICFETRDRAQYRSGFFFGAACYNWPLHKDPDFDDITAYGKLVMNIVEKVLRRCSPKRLDIIFDSMDKKVRSSKDEELIKHLTPFLEQIGVPYTIEGKTGQACNALYIADIAAGTCRRQLNGGSKYFHLLKPLLLGEIDRVDVLEKDEGEPETS